MAFQSKSVLHVRLLGRVPNGCVQKVLTVEHEIKYEINKILLLFREV